MPIVSDRPETGVRIHIERDPAAPTLPVRYQGAAHAPDASWTLQVLVEVGGAVEVTLDPEAPPALADKVRLIVRAAVRQAEDGLPPWRIVRWRGDK